MSGVSNIKIVKAAVSDAQSIARLESECIECPWSEKDIADSLANPLYDFYKAEIGGETVGYIGVSWCLDEGNVCNVAVRKDYRRKGIGKNLISAVMDEAVKRNAKRLFLEVNASNAAAIALYEKSGFKAVYSRPRYYGEDTAIIMSLETD